MRNFFRRFRRRLFRRGAARTCRPLLESLESRELLAFNLTLSTNATVNVSFTDTATTRTYTASATNANIKLSDIQAALSFPLNLSVVINTGSGGAEAGNITASSDVSFINAAGTGLTLNGAGAVSLAGLSLSSTTSSLVITAGGNVTLSSTGTSTSANAAGNMSITSSTGTITMPAGGQLVATTLSLTAPGGIGASGVPIFTKVDTLTADSSGSGGSQFFTQQSKGLTALNLNAGTGDVTLAVSTGGLTDSDGSTDITAANATVTLTGATPTFGSSSNPIGTSVDTLTVTTSTGNGSQFITEANGLTGLNLNAGSGNVTLALALGGLADADPDTDIAASTASITLSDPASRDVGSAASPINTSINDLSVSTAPGGGSQYITEFSGLTGLNLSAGTGNVALALSFGSLADGDTNSDITAAAASITTLSGSVQNVGSAGSSINTNVSDLTVNTSAGGGSQFVSNLSGLTGLNLNAGTGNATLSVAAGSVTDSDAIADVVASSASVTLSDLTARNFGTSANPIAVSATNLSISTAAGGGNQFLTAATSATIGSPGLAAGTGTIELDSGTFTLGGNNQIGSTSKLNVNGATFNIGTNNQTISGLTLASGSITGTTGVLTSNSTIQTQSGSISAILAGSVGLTQTTNGTTTLSGANTYVGATNLNQGTLKVSGGSAIPDTSDLTIALGATLGLGADEVIGTVTGAGSVVGSALPSTSGLTVINGGDFSGSMSGFLALTVNCVGKTLTLTGANAINGSTLVHAGTVLVNGSLSAGSLIVENGATLAGTGTVSTPLQPYIDIRSGAHLAPGASAPGVLTSDRLFFEPGANFDVALNGATLGTQYSQQAITAFEPLGAGEGALNVTLGFTPPVGTTFAIMHSTVGMSGQFTGLPEGKVFAVTTGKLTTTFEITYQGNAGKDVVLTTLDAANPVLQGTSADDIWLVKRNGANDEVTLNGNLIQSSPISSLSTLTINGLAGNDTLTVDASAGDPFPSGGITFHGGGQSGDKLITTGGTYTTITNNYTRSGPNLAGSIVLAGSQTDTLTYDGIQASIDLSGNTATNLIFNLPDLASTTTNNSNPFLEDDGTTGNSIAQLRSGNSTFPTTLFINPSGSLTITRGNSGDALTVSNLLSTDFNSSLTVGSAASGFSTIIFAGGLTLAADKSLSANATGTISLPNATSDLSVSGSGSVSFATAQNISLSTGSSISSVNGAITLSANQQATPTGGNFIGVDVNGGTIQATGSGTVTVLGTGGNSSTGSQIGVYVRSNALVSGGTGGLQLVGQGGGSGAANSNSGVLVDSSGQVTAAGSGGVAVQGTGGSTTGASNAGIWINGTGSIVTSNGGNVSLIGLGGSGTDSNSGVRIVSAQVSAGGNGAVSVQGTGGAGSSVANHGVDVSSVNGAITSRGGNVQVMGQGGGAGTSNSAAGVQVATGGQISAGQNGSIVVQGTGGTGSGGANFGVVVSSSSISSGGGNVQVTGIEGAGSSGWAIFASSGTISAPANGGALTLIGNSMDLGSATTISASTTSTVTLRPFTSGVAIDLGLATDPIGGPLGITDAELDRITAGTINIGDLNSGPIAISAPIDRGAGSTTAITLTTGGNNSITFSGTGSIDAKNGPVALLTSGSNLTFSGLTGGERDPFPTHYFEGNFEVTPLTGRWFEAHGGNTIGNPVPAMGGDTFTASMEVTSTTHELFNFLGLDLTGAVDFTFEGLLAGVTVFSASGTAPATSGFDTLNSPSTAAIDTLRVSIVRDLAEGYSLDNIRVTDPSNSTASITSSTAATDVDGASISLTSGSGGIGASGNPLVVAATSLNATTGGSGNQFITQTKTLSGLDLNAGTGNITFTVSQGAVSDTDADPDITAATASVTLADTTARDFGTAANPINIAAANLSVSTAAGNGNQFIASPAQGSTTINSFDAGNGSITLASGHFSLVLGNAIGDSSTLVINGPATLTTAVDQNTQETIGALVGSGTIEPFFHGSANALIVGGNNASTEFSGVFTSPALAQLYTVGITKVGSGTWTLSGTSQYLGKYDVQAGTMLVTGNTGAFQNTTIEDGATLAGTGTVGFVFAHAGGHFAPGNGVGTLNTNAVNLAPGSSFNAGITSAATGSYSQANTTGDVTIETTGAGVALNLAAVGTPTIHPGDRFTIINNGSSDPISGTFAGLPEGATVINDLVGSGIAARITYAGGDGNDAVLIVNSTPVITSGGGGATASSSLPENHTPVTTVAATDADPGQTLTYSISGGADAALFSIDPQSGALAFTTAPDFENPADANADNIYDVIVQASDGNLSTTQEIFVTVTNANDPPSFMRGPVAEAPDENPANHGPALQQTVVAWAKDITAGPSDESGQTLSFDVTNDDPTLFTPSGQPAIGPTGSLTFTPAPNAHGTAIITVTLHDNGGTADGGIDSSVPQISVIKITKPLIWHNTNAWAPANNTSGLDVNDDGHVVPADALAVINYLNRFGTFNNGQVPDLDSTLPTSPPVTVTYGGPFGYLDVTADGFVVPADALAIINVVNANQGGEGETSPAPPPNYFSAPGGTTETPAVPPTNVVASLPALEANNLPIHDELADLVALLAADSATATLKTRRSF